ncbi:MAG: TolB-like 6-bladed beta-propeller domain-containing protein, partial [Muribaculaceae bacterium]|nr:TolB-like 6-bladed beta-propeller domain-containing protein [Muribaculaceae bacterium]
MKKALGMLAMASLVFVGSCKQASTSGEECLNLNAGKHVEVDSVAYDCLLAVRSMAIVNDTLVIANNNDDVYFETYSLPSLQHIASGGNKGQGPGEFVDPLVSSMKPYFDGTFIIKESMGFSFDVVSLSTLSKIGQLSPQLPEDWYYVQDAFYLDKNLLAGENGYSPHVWAIFDQDGKELTEFPQTVPDDIKALAVDDFSKLVFDVSWGAASAKEKVLAIGYRTYPSVEYYDFEGQLVSKLESPYTVGDKLESWLSGLVASDEYLYINFRNRTPDAKSVNSIVKTDWHGAIKASYLVDRPVYNFAVDEKNGKIYFNSKQVSDDDYIYLFD